jgi:hypothetical protein
VNEMPDEAAEAWHRGQMREELNFIRAYIESRLAGGANIVSLLRAMASAVGAIAAQLPAPLPPEHAVALMLHEVQRSAETIMSMSPAERIAAARALQDG